MNRKPHLTVMNGIHVTGTHDVFSGLVKAFRLLGYHTDTILSHKLYRDWLEYCRFFGIINGVPNWSYTSDDIVKRASFNSVLSVMESNPDVLIIIDGTSVHREAWEWFKRLGIPTIIIGTECPYQDKFLTRVAIMADKTFVNEKTTAKKTGLEYLPLGYNSEAHHPMMVSTAFRHDVVFVGSGFKEREELLGAVDWTDIDFVLYGYYKIDHDHSLAPYYKDTMIPNAEAALLYNGAKISLNLNRISVDYEGQAIIPEAESLSPRVYEIAANGGFMLSEWRPEIDELFDDLVPTFTNGEQLNELVHYWLPKDKERQEIGVELAKIAKRHSYVERAKRIVKYISEELSL